MHQYSSCEESFLIVALLRGKKEGELKELRDPRAVAPDFSTAASRVWS